MTIFFQANDYIIVRLNVTQFPDRFSIDGGQTFVNATPSLDPTNATFGDWEWDNINKEIKFIGKLRENRLIVFPCTQEISSHLLCLKNPLTLKAPRKNVSENVVC